MYRVQCIIQRPGYRKRYLSGFYIPRQEGIPVSEMKQDCMNFICRQLEEHDPAFLQFNIELTIFRRMRTDFLYNACRVEE